MVWILNFIGIFVLVPIGSFLLSSLICNMVLKILHHFQLKIETEDKIYKYLYRTCLTIFLIAGLAYFIWNLVS